MAKQVNTIFLEEWLRNIGFGSNNSNYGNHSSSSSSMPSARAIIQAWADLRESLQHGRFQPNHLQSLKVLFNSQILLHVADPQAKLLLSILSSQNLNLPSESYPLLLRLLYVWIRKSFKPSLVLVDLAMEVLPRIFSTLFASRKSPFFYAQGVLLLGAFCFAPAVSEKSKTVCLELLCSLLEEDYRLVSSSEEIVPDILAGVGYALSSSVNGHFVRILNSFLGMWGKEGGPSFSVSHGLMILHLVEWIISGFFKSSYMDKIGIFALETLENPKENYLSVSVVMAAAGVLRACNRTGVSGQGPEILSQVRISAETRVESIAEDLILKTGGIPTSAKNSKDRLLLQCLSLACARSGSVTSRGPIFICLASALLTEIFPLQRFCMAVINHPHCRSGLLRLNEVKEHMGSILFKEAGVIAGILCKQYVRVGEENKCVVENGMWNYCRDIYIAHRHVALLLRGIEDELLGELEKIAESAFLMVVLFALAVTKHRVNSNFPQETQMETSVQILVSFSCVEYFRRMRLSEYMDTIRGVIMSVQENESACISFVESMPSYVDLTACQEISLKNKMEYIWSEDELQTARILFYLRVLRTCIKCVTTPVFRRVVAPTMFLYMGHPNEKVARASHSMFVGFLSAENDFNQEERVSLKEQLVFYYIQRSLAGYPGITPIKGLATGVAAVVRHLPAGSPATFYCIHSLIEKANGLCSDKSTNMADIWKNWQGESHPCKEILELLLRLTSLVDIQVLPDLMKLLAQLIVALPKDGQKLVLEELYSQVAESDDVTRKPTLVSWLQSLSYLCSQASVGGTTSTIEEGKINSSMKVSTDSSNLHARL